MTGNNESQQLTKHRQEESSRRYSQWRKSDIDLLLSDLEKDDHYIQWKSNKSGYSKRVADQVFSNTLYYEAIKFKVHWLEGRFAKWNAQFTQYEGDRDRLQTLRETMVKDFPYYDRCKHIFAKAAPRAPTVKPAEPVPEDDLNTNCEASSDWDRVTQDNADRSPPAAASCTSLSPVPRHTLTPPRKRAKSTREKADREYEMKLCEMEMRDKTMQHEERMQQMRLEQLRLEIELQKVKMASGVQDE